MVGSLLQIENDESSIIELKRIRLQNLTISHMQTDRLRGPKPLDFAYANRSIWGSEIDRFGGSTLANVLL